MKINLILFFLLITNSIFSQKKIDNSSIVIDKIKTQLVKEKVVDFFFYSTNCYADVVSEDSNNVSESFKINEFRIYCFWIQNNEFFIQKFDNIGLNFNVLNVSKPVKIERFEGFKIISENFEKIKKEKILDAKFYQNGNIVILDEPMSCITKFEIFNDKEWIYSDFLSFKINKTKSLNYKKNRQLNIVKLYLQCEQKINNLELQNSFITIKNEKILD